MTVWPYVLLQPITSDFFFQESFRFFFFLKTGNADYYSSFLHSANLYTAFRSCLACRLLQEAFLLYLLDEVSLLPAPTAPGTGYAESQSQGNESALHEP